MSALELRSFTLVPWIFMTGELHVVPHVNASANKHSLILPALNDWVNSGVTEKLP